MNGVTDGRLDLHWTDSAFSPPDLIQANLPTRGLAAQVTGLSLSQAPCFVLCIDCEQTQRLPPRGFVPPGNCRDELTGTGTGSALWAARLDMGLIKLWGKRNKKKKSKEQPNINPGIIWKFWYIEVIIGGCSPRSADTSRKAPVKYDGIMSPALRIVDH